MRRKDREITDPEKIKDIINRCTCCRIGFNDHDEVYIVPLSFGYQIVDNSYLFYFHGAKEGRKIDLIQNSPKVGFEMDTNYVLKTAETACEHTAKFQSIIGNGIVDMVKDIDEKKHGLSLIMNHTVEEKDWVFDEKMIKEVAVFKLKVTNISCKEHN